MKNIKKSVMMQAIPNPKLSIIVSTFNEPSHLWFTICSILDNLKTFPNLAEILVSNNSPNVKVGMDDLRAKNIKIFDVVDKSTSTVRNVPAAAAKGEILCFCDTHIYIVPGAFDHAIKLFDSDSSVGILHGRTYMLGGDGFSHYKLTLEENFCGTNSILTDKNFRTLVPASGHGFYFIRKSLFDKIGGYLDTQKSWGGEEIFMELACWMHDYQVVFDPAIEHYHLPGIYRNSNTRNGQEFIVNNMAAAYVLGGQPWLDKIAPYYLQMGETTLKPRLARIPSENQHRRDSILKTAKYTLEEVFAMWDDIGLKWRE